MLDTQDSVKTPNKYFLIEQNSLWITLCKRHKKQKFFKLIQSDKFTEAFTEI